MPIHPGTRRIGAGVCKKERDEAVLHPANGQAAAPSTFAFPERPNPIPEDNPSPGFPVTPTFYGRTFEQLSANAKVQAKLLEASGAAVERHVATPSTPANASVKDNFRTICLIPKKTAAAEGHVHRGHSPAEAGDQAVCDR